MPRSKTISSATFPYHIRARSNDQRWFNLPLNIIWRICEEELAEVVERYEARVIAFVLMANHFHLLLRTPQANLGLVLNYLMREIARRVNLNRDTRDHVFGGTAKRTLIESDTYFYSVYKYVYRNPVEAGLCTRAEHYPYSTLRGVVGWEKYLFPLDEAYVEASSFIPRSIPERLAWMNRPTRTERRAEIKESLNYRRTLIREMHRQGT
jgi:putative transposase